MLADRGAALDDLLHRRLPTDRAVRALSRYGWDCDEPIRNLEPALAAALGDAVAGRLSVQALVEWADAVEGRDDVGYEEPVHTILFELSTPELHGEPTTERLAKFLRDLAN